MSRSGRRGQHRRRSRQGSEQGQTTIEFALVLPFVALLLVGLVELARVCALQIAVVDAARAGARAAVVDPRLGVAQQAAAAGSEGKSMTVTIDVGAGSPSLVHVHVERSVSLLPGLGWSSVDLEASSTMAVEADQ